MIKKILAHLLGIVMFLAVLGLTFVLSARELLDGTVITDVIEEALKEQNVNVYTSDMINEILGTDYQDLNDYVEEQELKEKYSKLLSDYIKYYIGMDIDISQSTNEVKEFIQKTCEKYEQETGTEVDESLIDDYFEALEEAVEKEKPEENQMVASIFNTIYSDALLMLLIGIIIVCAILIFLLRGRQILIHFIIVLVVNGLCTGIFSYLLNLVNIGTDIADKLMNDVIAQMKTLAIASFIAAIIFMILNILLKKTKKKVVPETTPSETSIPVEEVPQNYANITSETSESTIASEETLEQQNNNFPNHE